MSTYIHVSGSLGVVLAISAFMGHPVYMLLLIPYEGIVGIESFRVHVFLEEEW